MTDGYATTGAGPRVDLMRRDRYETLLAALTVLEREIRDDVTRLALAPEIDNCRGYVRMWADRLADMLSQHREA